MRRSCECFRTERKERALAKKKTKKSLIFKLALAAFFVYVAVSFTFMQVDISRRKETLEAVREEYRQQSYINQEVTNILNSGENADYIMKIAREKLGFVLPDEQVFIDYNRKE